MLFRNCHSAAPTCSPSRAALLTGRWPHSVGMLGLAGDGYRLADYHQHAAWYLKSRGYETVLSGVQHIARAPHAPPRDVLPYDRFLNHTPSRFEPEYDTETVVSSARDYLHESHDRPFFLSVGFFEPHRTNRGDRRCFAHEIEAEPAEVAAEARYDMPLGHLPDTPTTRRESANFRRGVAIADRKFGAVLDAIDSAGLRDETLVICTTDHGPGFPGAKKTLTDRGTGVMLILRGPGVPAGSVNDSLVSQIDLVPTVTELVGVPTPRWAQGVSLAPLLRGERDSVREELFSEQTFHDDYCPLRAVRTDRYKYIRNFDVRSSPGVDRGPAQALWESAGWGSEPAPTEELYDLLFDPNETNNLATGSPSEAAGPPQPAQVEAQPSGAGPGPAADSTAGSRDERGIAAICADLRSRLHRWMEETDDPLLRRQFPATPVTTVATGAARPGARAYRRTERRFQGIPGIEASPDGSLLITFYTGGPGEGSENHVVLASYRPSHDAVTDPIAVVDPPGAVRAFDPGLWVDPSGTLWWYWNQSTGWFDGVAGVWAARSTGFGSASAPSHVGLKFEKPRRIGDGIMMNKPTVRTNGEWIFPAALWRNAPRPSPRPTPEGELPVRPGALVPRTGAHLLITRDGETFGWRLGPDFPERAFDEHMVIERTDGGLLVAARTQYGIARQVSYDHGLTWRTLGATNVWRVGPSTRFFLRRLASGRLLLVYHDAARTRSHLTAYLSEDDGDTFPWALLLDARTAVSYPDGIQTIDGRIWIVYDRERTGAMEILLASITETDIIAGSLSDSASFLRRVVTVGGVP